VKARGAQIPVKFMGLSTRRRHAPVRSWLAALAAAALLTTLATGTATAATPTTAAAGDPTVISDWNALAVTTLVGDTTKQGTETILYMGFVQAAVYDAVVGVEGRYEPYRFHAHAPRGTSAQAAAVAAAHKVLVTYVPSAQANLDERYAASLAQLPDGKAKTQGIAFGNRAADNLIRLRANDGRNDASILFTQPPAPGVWRPTPPAFAPMITPWMGFVTPLLVHSPTQFAPPASPKLTSARYTRDFNEVKAFGSATSTARTPAQTDTAVFFSGNPLIMFNTALRDQVTVRHLDIVDAARMFAAIDMSIADAIITVWHAKYVDGTWRPITAITLADTDGNPATDPDPSWVPLFPTPAYPEYPSGYTAFEASASRGLGNVFHTRHLQLTLTSTAAPNLPRQYDSGDVLRQDVVNARMWLGIHFRFGDTAARDLGVRLADWTLDHYFQHAEEKR
jgi:hypothetical protein